MTKIEWTDKSWNVTTGCTPISPGCKNCYARRMARRLAGRYGYPEAPHHFDVTLRPDRLEQPLKWKKPRKIFVCSMSDLFHEDVPDDFIVNVFVAMGEAHQHIYQILTKRPKRMAEFINKSTWGISPLSNVWLGVTVCNQEETWKIVELLRIPAAVRFVSVEPMLEEINLNYIHCENYDINALKGEAAWFEKRDMGSEPMGEPTEKIDQVICGAETGPGKRPMNLAWARSLRDQCQAAGTAFFFKKDSEGRHTLDGRAWEEFPR